MDSAAPASSPRSPSTTSEYRLHTLHSPFHLWHINLSLPLFRRCTTNHDATHTTLAHGNKTGSRDYQNIRLTDTA